MIGRDDEGGGWCVYIHVSNCQHMSAIRHGQRAMALPAGVDLWGGMVVGVRVWQS